MKAKASLLEGLLVLIQTMHLMEVLKLFIIFGSITGDKKILYVPVGWEGLL